MVESRVWIRPSKHGNRSKMFWREIFKNMAESEDEEEFFAKIDLEDICATAGTSERRKRFAEVAQENIDELLNDVK